jgi:small subunit ribosomal protein S20
MPNTKSSAKDLRQSKKSAQRNYRTKSNIKSLMKKIDKAITAGDKTKLTELVKKVQSLIDKAAKMQVIKKNNAARKKSRLLKKINQKTKA